MYASLLALYGARFSVQGLSFLILIPLSSDAMVSSDTETENISKYEKVSFFFNIS